MTKKVFIKSLGCKVNSYDGDSLESGFKSLGYSIVDESDNCDIAVLNSCSVTAAADRDSRHLLRRFRRQNPEAMVVATGCYAQTDSKVLADMPEVDWVVPNQKKQDLVDLIHKRAHGQQEGLDSGTKMPRGLEQVEKNRQGHFKSSLSMPKVDSSKTRAFLKIQDGCNGFCSYCLIPYARGQSRSVAKSEILAEVRRQIDAGTKEIVFTGIHIGDYGRDLASPSKDPFSDLVKEIMDWPDMVRLRISSLEPGELSEGLLKALSQRPDKFCDHFHMPLQSGHDRILKKMRRSYTTQEFADKVAMAKSYFPAAFFATDLIPGFPSETSEEALASEAFVETIGLHEMHIFPYSKRPNTAAIKMADHVDGGTIKERARSLRELSSRLKAAYIKQNIGETKEVLWEGRRTSSGQIIGRSSNYLEVIAASHFEPAAGSLSYVHFKGLHAANQLYGMPVS